MNNAQPAPPSPDSDVTLPASSSELETTSQSESQPPRTETHDDPDTRLSDPEDAAGDETADLQPAPEETDDVQSEPLPAADATPETGVATDNAENSPTAQAGDMEADLTPASDEPDIEAAAIAVVADNIVEAEKSPSHLQPELLADISASMEEQTDKLTRLSSALFAMDKRFTELSASVAQLSQDMQKVSEETEQTVNWTEAVAITSSLSRWFLALSIFILIVLLGGMGYLAVNQYQLMQQQRNASQAAATATELQVKRMAEFDKRFAELVGGAIKSERETINKESVASKINKLRGGATERRILRKSSGDWLIPNGKTEDLVTDPEIIEALNLAFEKSGRPLITPPSLPPHKLVCILKPNGKGGTEVMLTRETVP